MGPIYSEAELLGLLAGMDVGRGPFTVVYYPNLRGFCVEYCRADGRYGESRPATSLIDDPAEAAAVCRDMNRRATRPTEEERRNDYANYYF